MCPTVTELSCPAPPATAVPVIVADDDAGVCLLMEEALTQAGFDVTLCHTGAEVISAVERGAPRLLLLDLRLTDMDAEHVIESLRSHGRSVPFVIVSGLADTRVAVEYMRRGARDYLIKDSGFLDLVPTVVQRTLADIARDEEIKRLQREILEISEREQRRIGQDIHDDLCQRLAAIKMKLQHLGDDLQAVAPALARDASAIGQHLGEATRVARALARGLSPVDIGHEGLPAALSGLVRTAEEIFQISCPLRTEGVCTPLDHHVSTQFYRIAQEAIANAVKHAKATEVRVVLHCSPSPVRLTIANDGQPMPRRPRSTGLGLHLMRQRVESIGAQLEIIHNPPGATTAIQVTLPMP